MRKRLTFLFLIGAVIVGSSATLASVNLDCPHCKAGIIECDQCNSTGAFIIPLMLECTCKREDPNCPTCGGTGWYFSFFNYTTGVCEACQGKGGMPCLRCGGEGKILLKEKVLRKLLNR